MVEDLLKEGVWWSTARTQSSAGILHVAWVGWVAALIKRCLQKSKLSRSWRSLSMCAPCIASTCT